MMKTNIGITGKEEGKTLGVAGGNYRIIISGQQTGGVYAVIEMHVPPGGGPPPHAHPDFQETFYVLEGEVLFKTEAGNSVVSQGGFVNIPLGGAIHCFQNVSGNMAKLLCTVMPAGLEQVFEAIGQPVGPGVFLPVPEMTDERRRIMAELDEKHHQKTYPKDFLD